MRFEEFKRLYTTACKLRDEFAPQMGPWFRKDASQWPPVIGFGLPSDCRKVKLVTVALNPSNLEIEDGHIPKTNDVNIQWEKQRGYFKSGKKLYWFDRSEMVLKEACVGTYRASDLVHLDLSPQPTSDGFDGIYDKIYKEDTSSAELETARRFIRCSVEKILLPTLETLARDNDTLSIMIYGFIPKIPGQRLKGSHTMGDILGQEKNLFQNVEVDSGSGNITIAQGEFNPQHRWIDGYTALHDAHVVFLSQGPSSRRASDDDLRFVGRRLRELGWL
ncbi:MAG: hypothetical protein OXU78_08955 [Deltaproteobacteria bacterium]|nr:hypothetical protein [Deltaproteobacteria bacterium]